MTPKQALSKKQCHTWTITHKPDFAKGELEGFLDIQNYFSLSSNPKKSHILKPAA